MTWKKKRPAGVEVSIESVRLRKFTPRACNSDTSVIRSRTLRPSRSSFHTTSTSPGRSRHSTRFNPGLLAFFPLAVSSKTSSHSARISAFSVNRGSDPLLIGTEQLHRRLERDWISQGLPMPTIRCELSARHPQVVHCAYSIWSGTSAIRL